MGPAKDEEEVVQVPDASAANSLGPDDDDVGHFTNWLQAMQSGTQPNATVDHGFSHALVWIMAARSYREGRRLYWDPVRKQILDHPAAEPRPTG